MKDLVFMGALLLNSVTIGALHIQSQTEVRVYLERPDKPYVILQTLKDSKKERLGFAVCSGVHPLPETQQAEFIRKMQPIALQVGADGLYIVRSGTWCQATQTPVAGAVLPGGVQGTLPGAILTYRLEVDVIKFIDKEIAARRIPLSDQPVFDKRRTLQEMYQQTRGDAVSSSMWAVQAYEVGEYRWTVQLLYQAMELDRDLGLDHSPYLIAALVRDGEEKEAEKLMKKVLKDVRTKMKKDPEYDARAVVERFKKLASEMPPKWNALFQEAANVEKTSR